MEKRCENNSLNHPPKIIVITGAESTGKSTLTEQLANYYNVPFIPEYARSYIENLGRNYIYSDVENIAKLQVEQFRRCKNSENPYIFLDTWLIITKIWFEVVFKKEPHWLNDKIQNANIDLFLVCDIDLPWIPDTVRENGGKMREMLHTRYINTISRFNFKYKIISGHDEERIRQALLCLNEIQ